MGCNACEVENYPTRRVVVEHGSGQGFLLQSCDCAGKDRVPGEKKEILLVARA